MLSAIKDIGDLVVKQTLSINMAMEGKVFVIILDIDNESSELGIEDFDSEKTEQYLFKTGTSKGNAPSPIAPLNNKNPKKTYEKIARWIKKCNDISGISETDKSVLDKINKIIDSEKDSIVISLQNKVKELPKTKGEGRFLTLKLNRDKYLGDYEIFRKAVTYFADKKFGASSGESKVCSICGLAKDKVGKTNVFKFSTDDKPGFIAGGFKKADTWKNFPVCPICNTSLGNGKNFIETKLNFRFVYGLNYYLIPRLLIGSEDILYEILNILSDANKTVSLKGAIKKRITIDENEILEYLSEKEDTMTLNFLFLQKIQSAERILLLIEDVFPSRIRKIFKAKDNVDKVFNNNSDKGFTFGTIRTFFSKSSEGKKESDLNKYFLEIVNNVFKGRRLDFDFLLKFYMATIRKEFINDGYFMPRVKDALMNTMFFENLGLINFKEVMDMEESIFEEVFKKYSNTFSSPVKRGIFLLGALTQKLLNIQAYERKGAKPFMKKLKSLKMDQKDIMGLLPAVQDKLEQYDSFDKWRRLAQESSKYLLVNTGDDWRLSIDEINFYFACGMNLMEQVTNIIYPENKKEE